MSGSLPIPRNKPGIAAATALAAEYLGMKLIYLEAGSGADYPVPNEMVKAVSDCALCLSWWEEEIKSLKSHDRKYRTEPE